MQRRVGRLPGAALPAGAGLESSGAAAEDGLPQAEGLVIEGRRLVVVDDSIVHDNTSWQFVAIVANLRRGVSIAYYALVHETTALAVEYVLRSAPDDAKSRACRIWRPSDIAAAAHVVKVRAQMLRHNPLPRRQKADVEWGPLVDLVARDADMAEAARQVAAVRSDAGGAAVAAPRQQRGTVCRDHVLWVRRRQSWASHLTVPVARRADGRSRRGCGWVAGGAFVALVGLTTSFLFATSLVFSHARRASHRDVTRSMFANPTGFGARDCCPTSPSLRVFLPCRLRGGRVRRRRSCRCRRRGMRCWWRSGRPRLRRSARRS